MKITHELSSKQSAGAASAPLTCICCDTSTWLATFIPEQVVTEQPSVTAAPVAKVNELSGNCLGPAKFVSLQVCLHLMSSALSMDGWSGLRASFHRSYNATWARAQRGFRAGQFAPKMGEIGFCWLLFFMIWFLLKWIYIALQHKANKADHCFGVKVCICVKHAEIILMLHIAF